MPNAHGSKAIALLLVWIMVAGVLVLSTNASARSVETISATSPMAPTGSAQVSPVANPVETPTTGEPAPAATPDAGPSSKLAPDLMDGAQHPQKGFVSVVIHTMDVPSLSKALAAFGARSLSRADGAIRDQPFAARSWGAVGQPTAIQANVPWAAVAGIAALPFVTYVDRPEIASTMVPQDGPTAEDQMTFQQYVDRLKLG